MSIELNVGRVTESLQSPGANGLRETTKDLPGIEMPGEGPGPIDGSTFSQVLERSLDQVNTNQVQADTAIRELVAGRTKNIHETMLAIERADTSLKLAMQVRNKILDAYREVMRMQV